ncbi:stimulus-sensing domain-containing protein [Rhabdaerophilum sp. SD176]|uniref:stimulus-sensing domain-containing protein n=1 Tax=Rhabdaerophilum sp. SD176 TaxID=2983548 RepID=UPI0024DFFA53|nr:stimulus-sensing domain-containing protein [Rhabdaerophilum sp. SD176]
MLDRNPASRIAGPDPAEPAAPVRRGLRSSLLRFTARFRMGLVRRLSSSLTRRIAFLNIAGLLALFLGFLWLNQTRVGVIDARSQSLSLQAEIISAAIASAASTSDNTIQLDPEKLLQQQLSETPQREEQALDWFEFSINPARVAPILKRLVTPTRTRARIFDQDGLLLLDTKAFYTPGAFSDPRPPTHDESDWTLFTRSWNAVKQRFGRVDLSQQDSPTTQRLPEVQRALKGTSGNVVRVAADGQTIVYAASPIQRSSRIKGALLLSTQEGDVDRIIAEERWGFVLVFLIASGVMLVLSVLLAGTIAEPVRRLSEAADRVRRGTRAREEIPDFSDRSDEIGQLSVSLRDMTGSLYSRIEAIERFAADVAHELKNPLTSLRSAVETLPLARNPDSRDRLLAVIVHDVKRLDRLITDISDASRLDAELQRAQANVFDLGALLGTVAGMKNDVLKPGEARVEVILPASGPKIRPMLIRGHDSRIVQVFNNLIDNAQSFSPEGGTVRVTAASAGPRVEIRIEDDGPGIPDHALERIFERFYTDRPDHGFGQNSGLGLAISKQIVEAHGGTIRAENILSADGQRAGARFVVSLPLAGASG